MLVEKDAQKADIIQSINVFATLAWFYLEMDSEQKTEELKQKRNEEIARNTKLKF